MQVALTIDIDMMDYDRDRQFDEMETVFPVIQRCLKDFPAIKTTWFIRMDLQTEEFYGKAAYIFEKHAEKIDWLRANGHEIGWHHHAYKRDGARWVQDTSEGVVCDGLKRYGGIALKSGLKIARMGWGFHTNATMKTLDGMGFLIDSTAIPRPRYKWNNNPCDWSISPQCPYRPSVRDYRAPGESNLAIWEVPMTTTAVRMPADTENDVVRYIELTYKDNVFRKAIGSVSGQDRIVLIFHPYKMLKSSLPSCDVSDVRKNLEALSRPGNSFITISGALN